MSFKNVAFDAFENVIFLTRFENVTFHDKKRPLFSISKRSTSSSIHKKKPAAGNILYINLATAHGTLNGHFNHRFQ